MRGPHNIWRLIRTGATFERSGAMDVVLEALEAPARLRFAAWLLGWPFKWLGLRGDPALPPVTRALTALGPAYIKFGQVLSTRPDIVGEELSQQLKYLQDKLPPFPAHQARAIIEAEFGQPVQALFQSFDDKPVAAASIAVACRWIFTPIGVSRHARGKRSTSTTCSSASRAARRRLTVAWSTPIARAAPDSVPTLATARK